MTIGPCSHWAEAADQYATSSKYPSLLMSSDRTARVGDACQGITGRKQADEDELSVQGCFHPCPDGKFVLRSDAEQTKKLVPRFDADVPQRPDKLPSTRHQSMKDLVT